jgi:hypothetical protein
LAGQCHIDSQLEVLGSIDVDGFERRSLINEVIESQESFEKDRDSNPRMNGLELTEEDDWTEGML